MADQLREIAPWYSHVEKFIGVCGTRDGIEAMPDGEFLPPFDFNCAEDTYSKNYQRNIKTGTWCMHAGHTLLSRSRNSSYNRDEVKCQARNLCMRGCPFGGYFSSVSSTLPWAKNTGNLTVRPFSVVHSIIYDEQKGKAVGVRVIDSKYKRAIDYFARIIFVNASALNSNLILLNSTSNAFPNGLGNDNGLLGKYVAFHNYRASVNAEIGWIAGQVYIMVEIQPNRSLPTTATYINRIRIMLAVSQLLWVLTERQQ